MSATANAPLIAIANAVANDPLSQRVEGREKRVESRGNCGYSDLPQNCRASLTRCLPTNGAGDADQWFECRAGQVRNHRSAA